MKLTSHHLLILSTLHVHHDPMGLHALYTSIGGVAGPGGAVSILQLKEAKFVATGREGTPEEDGADATLYLTSAGTLAMVNGLRLTPEQAAVLQYILDHAETSTAGEGRVFLSDLLTAQPNAHPNTVTLDGRGLLRVSEGVNCPPLLGLTRLGANALHFHATGAVKAAPSALNLTGEELAVLASLSPFAKNPVWLYDLGKTCQAATRENMDRLAQLGFLSVTGEGMAATVSLHQSGLDALAVTEAETSTPGVEQVNPTALTVWQVNAGQPVTVDVQGKQVTMTTPSADVFRLHPEQAESLGLLLIQKATEARASR